MYPTTGIELEHVCIIMRTARLKVEKPEKSRQTPDKVPRVTDKGQEATKLGFIADGSTLYKYHTNVLLDPLNLGRIRPRGVLTNALAVCQINEF
uniref:Uncharacterized protein n=1 Tax=Caenorhabditis japonica TaxID=281687 RepID=A0A8R1ENN3_CAEJA